MKQLITTSSIKCKNRCTREYYYRVECGMDGIESSRALNWGRVWDAVQARLWTPNSSWESLYSTPFEPSAIECGRADPAWTSLSEVDQINIEVLANGYTEYWRSAQASIERATK